MQRKLQLQLLLVFRSLDLLPRVRGVRAGEHLFSYSITPSTHSHHLHHSLKSYPQVPETTPADEDILELQQQQQQQQHHDSFGGLSVMPSERSIASEIQGLETSGVVEQAYRRYLQDVQQRVEEAAFEKERFVRQVKEERDDAERKRVERKQASLDLQAYLKSQISCKTNEMNRLTLERRQDGNTLHISSLFSLQQTITTYNRSMLLSTTSGCKIE